MSSFIKIELKTLVGLPCSPILSIGFYPFTPAKNLGYIPNFSISHSAVFKGKVLILPPNFTPLLSSFKVSTALIATNLTWTTYILTVVSGIDILHNFIVCSFVCVCALAKETSSCKG